MQPTSPTQCPGFKPSCKMSFIHKIWFFWRFTDWSNENWFCLLHSQASSTFCLLRWMKALVTFISPSQGDHYKLQLQNNKEQNTFIKHLFSWTVSLLVTTSPVLQCTYHRANWVLHKHLVSVVAHFFCTDFPFYKVCFHQQVGGPEMPYQGRA